MLLGATLLPVADILSSEDLELSATFSCPNESEPTDKGDLSVIPEPSFFKDGGYFHLPGTPSLDLHGLVMR